MKAWTVSPLCEFFGIVFFAETRGKAKSLAMQNDIFGDYHFTKLEARRLSVADKMYNNRSEMDWDNQDDRSFLIKECGWHCEYPEFEDCLNCKANEYCDIYNDSLESEV